MKIFRSHIFETNSSSTHALVTYTGDHPDIDIPKKVSLMFGEFGWGYNTYYDTQSKLSYILTLIYSLNDKHNEILDMFCKILDDEKIEYKLPVVEKDEWGYEDIGYVDHNTEAAAWLMTLLANKQKFLNFVFDDRSYISTGNDNDEGYYMPEIGYEAEFYSEDYSGDKWDEAVGRYEIDHNCDVYLKGN